ncbi:MAG: hypothetical protein HYX57_11820 [Chloroflexi bacterium]|nr:hypothetical protein [Chloroflexota bacterium]
MALEGPIDPAQRRLAERRLVEALRRLLRREPLRSDVRVDPLIAAARAADPTKPSSHRGRHRLTLSDGDLHAVVDGLVASGALHRKGHRVSLPGREPALDPIMRERVDQLIGVLRAGGVMPPPAEPAAARLGIPPALVDQLRAAGELIAVAPRIDYPRATWAGVAAALDRLAAEAPLSVRRVRDGLGATRRHAEAILRRHVADRDSRGVE